MVILLVETTYSYLDLLHILLTYYIYYLTLPLFQLTLITYTALLQVERSVGYHLVGVVPHNLNHVIEMQTAIPGWATSKREETATIFMS
jgi:hypothetical protein